MHPVMAPHEKTYPGLLVLPFLFLAFTAFPSEAAYQVKSHGFLTAFNRNEPLLLFRTAMGLQVLTSNQSCFNNQSSVYYSSGSLLKYVSYSTMENFLVIVNEEDQICFRNLYKSDWNYAIERDISTECKSQSIGKPNRLFAYSINLRAMFSIGDTDGTLYLFSPKKPPCGFSIASLANKYAKLLHVTNFAQNKDLVLVGFEKSVQVFSTSGNPVRIFALDSSETLMAIDSQEIQGMKYFYLALERESEAVLLQFKLELDAKGKKVLLQAANRTVASLSATGHSVAFMLRERGNRKSHWIYLLSPFSQPGGETIYQCNAGDDLIEAILVEKRQQRFLDYCKDRSNWKNCWNLGDGGICDREKLFSFREIPLMNKTEVFTDRELQEKTTLIFALAGMCFLKLALYLFVNNGSHVK